MPAAGAGPAAPIVPASLSPASFFLFFADCRTDAVAIAKKKESRMQICGKKTWGGWCHARPRIWWGRKESYLHCAYVICLICLCNLFLAVLRKQKWRSDDCGGGCGGADAETASMNRKREEWEGRRPGPDRW